MGASLVYLEKPNTEIAFESGQNDKMRFAAGEMQGWRLNMVSTLEQSIALGNLLIAKLSPS